MPSHLGPIQLNPIMPKVSNMVSTCCGMDSPEKASVSRPTTIKNAANRPFIISDCGVNPSSFVSSYSRVMRFFFHCFESASSSDATASSDTAERHIFDLGPYTTLRVNGPSAPMNADALLKKKEKTKKKKQLHRNVTIANLPTLTRKILFL